MLPRRWLSVCRLRTSKSLLRSWRNAKTSEIFASSPSILQVQSLKPEEWIPFCSPDLWCAGCEDVDDALHCYKQKNGNFNVGVSCRETLSLGSLLVFWVIFRKLSLIIFSNFFSFTPFTQTTERQQARRRCLNDANVQELRFSMRCTSQMSRTSWRKRVP